MEKAHSASVPKREKDIPSPNFQEKKIEALQEAFIKHEDSSRKGSISQPTFTKAKVKEEVFHETATAPTFTK